MIRRVLAVSLLLLPGAGFAAPADMPPCSNRVISQVVKRVGCTVGDAPCWLSKGGMCTDYIQKRAGRPGKDVRLIKRISPEEVRKGDVAQFRARTHYAYVEKVIRDKQGIPVAVTVSEYNHGTCWVDRSVLVTDQYGIVSRRAGIPLSEVDGGFVRPE